MGISIGNGNKKDRNVELNVVPFIDLMSCLTAFLLVTAVWSQYSQVATEQEGIGQSGELPDPDTVRASILLTTTDIWVGNTHGDRRQIPRSGGLYDWDSLEMVLADYRKMDDFDNRRDIELAAEDPVLYQDIVAAMDVANVANFKKVGVVDPASLSVRFRE